MDDLISRQAAIDAIENTDWYHVAVGKLVHGANSKEDEPLYKAEDIYSVIENLPSTQPEHWIPCEERLPEVGTYVLVSKKPLGFRSNIPNVCTAHRSHDPRSGKEEWNDMLFGKLDDDDVLAWMPLHAPYEERREE